MRLHRFWVNGSVSWNICTVHTTSPAATVKTCFLRIGHERSRFLILRRILMFVQSNYLFTKPFNLVVKLKHSFQTISLSLHLNLFCAHKRSLEVKCSVWPPFEMMWRIRAMKSCNTAFVVSVETENVFCYILPSSYNPLCDGLCWTQSYCKMWQ